MNISRVYGLVGLSILSLAFIAPAAQGKKEDPPANQGKAPLKMSSPVIDLSPGAVTISWSTNKAADSSIVLSTMTNDPSIVLGQTAAKHHEISIDPLSPGQTYEYIAASVGESGEIVLARGSFVAL